MITAVVDTNVFIAGVLTNHPRSASRQVIDRQEAGDFTLALSPETLQEVLHVFRHPHLRLIHHLSDAEIRQFARRLEVGSRIFSGAVDISPSLTRDATDTKWVALSLEADADYLITLDNRHLGKLKRVGRTKIVTPAAFLRALDRSK